MPARPVRGERWLVGMTEAGNSVAASVTVRKLSHHPSCAGSYCQPECRVYYSFLRVYNGPIPQLVRSGSRSTTTAYLGIDWFIAPIAKPE